MRKCRGWSRGGQAGTFNHVLAFDLDHDNEQGGITRLIKRPSARWSKRKGMLARCMNAGLVAHFLIVLLLSNACHFKKESSPITVDLPREDPWTEAVRKVEEDRGEPAGRQTRVEIPAQLKLPEEPRRFLAIQVAESLKQHLATPHDFADLASMIAKGEFVEVPSLGKAYILYGVGTSATEEPFTHFDKDSGKSVTLYQSSDDLQREYERISAALETLQSSSISVKKELLAAPKRDADLRKRLKAELVDNGNAAAAEKKRKELLDTFYKDPASRKLLESEYQILMAAAHQPGKQQYDLNDGPSRKLLKIHLLSHLRPAAFTVLQELAQLYQDKFGRPLPVTSLVRPDEYQRDLHETNRNAVIIDVPPHSTGLAFDIYYRYMTAGEQEFVMAQLARLQDEGKIQALHENINNYHVFVFLSGSPPSEELITKSIPDIPERPVKAPRKRSKRNRRRH